MKIFKTVILATSLMMSLTVVAEEQIVIEKAAEYSVKQNSGLLQKNMTVQLSNDIRKSLSLVRIPLQYQDKLLLTKNKLKSKSKKNKPSE